MTNHFCGIIDCILADGNLKVCLFGNAEVSLRDAMRVDNATDDELKTIVEGAVEKESKTRRDGEFSRNGKPIDDTHRRIIC